MWQVGHEIGTSTGRTRRCGWLDLVVVKYTNRYKVLLLGPQVVCLVVPGLKRFAVLAALCTAFWIVLRTALCTAVVCTTHVGLYQAQRLHVREPDQARRADQPPWYRTPLSANALGTESPVLTSRTRTVLCGTRYCRRVCCYACFCNSWFCFCNAAYAATRAFVLRGTEAGRMGCTRG